jgi:uncharacterized membrane protein YdjX (TVP38/TMEM64 family)
MNPRALLIPLLIVAIVLTAIFLPVEQLLMEIQYWVEENESSAMFIVGMVLVIGILLMLPMSLMLMLTGFLFGLAQGFAVAWLAGLLPDWPVAGPPLAGTENSSQDDFYRH